MLTKSEIAYQVEDITGIKPNLTKAVIDALATIAVKEISSGEDFSLPGVVRFKWGYTKPLDKGAKYKKGDEYVGFGGVEQTAEADSKEVKASVKLVASPASDIKKIVPKKSDRVAQRKFLQTRAGKQIVSRKG